MSGDRIVKTVDHGTRVVGGVEVRIEQECWRSGGSSFSVIRVSDDADLTQDVLGECFDGPPSDEQIADLLRRWDAGERADHDPDLPAANDRGRWFSTVEEALAVPRPCAAIVPTAGGVPPWCQCGWEPKPGGPTLADHLEGKA